MHIVLMANLPRMVKSAFSAHFLDISPKMAPVLLDFSSLVKHTQQTSTPDEPMVHNRVLQFPLHIILLLYAIVQGQLSQHLSQEIYLFSANVKSWYIMRILRSFLIFTIQCIYNEKQTILKPLQDGVINWVVAVSWQAPGSLLFTRKNMVD